MWKSTGSFSEWKYDQKLNGKAKEADEKEVYVHYIMLSACYSGVFYVFNMYTPPPRAALDYTARYYQILLCKVLLSLGVI